MRGRLFFPALAQKKCHGVCALRRAGKDGICYRKGLSLQMKEYTVFSISPIAQLLFIIIIFFIRIRGNAENRIVFVSIKGRAFSYGVIQICIIHDCAGKISAT